MNFEKNRSIRLWCRYGFEADGTSVHDVLDVFMLTGLSRQTGQCFMKASLVRPGHYLEFLAETGRLERTGAQRS